jgi:hypothetical protein
MFPNVSTLEDWRLRMKSSEEKLLFYLVAVAQEYGIGYGVYCDIEGLVRWTGLSRGTIYRALSSLSHRDYIKRDKNFRPIYRVEYTSSHQMVWLMKNASAWKAYKKATDPQAFIRTNIPWGGNK